MGFIKFLENLFKKNDEVEKKLNEKISNLEATISRKDKEISDLINEIERINQTGGNLNNKQMELIEKNIKETKEESNRLKSILERYNIPITREKYYYKIELDRFFVSAKFKELVEYLVNANVHYVQDITKEILAGIPTDMKNLDEAKSKLDDFWSKDFIEWDIVTYMNKGEKVTKIYAKSRKFTNILAEEKIEYIEDMKNYDFSRLTVKGFKNKKIEELKKLRDDFYAEKRVSL